MRRLAGTLRRLLRRPVKAEPPTPQPALESSRLPMLALPAPAPASAVPPPPAETALLRSYVRVLRGLDMDGRAPLSRHLANRLGRAWRKPTPEQLSRLVAVKDELRQALHALELLEIASDQIDRHDRATAEQARELADLEPLRAAVARSR